MGYNESEETAIMVHPEEGESYEATLDEVENYDGPTLEEIDSLEGDNIEVEIEDGEVVVYGRNFPADKRPNPQSDDLREVDEALSSDEEEDEEKSALEEIDQIK